MGGSWSRDAVIYEVYVRSFADSNGDGVGDLPGVTSRLDYLADLGVDAVWLTPFYRSPMADGGYDVADPRAVDPSFGTLADLDELVAQAHARHLKVIVDLVPNHTSSQHPWFQAALAAGPGSPERARYHFAAGTGSRRDQPPNNWRSIFSGPAWTRVDDGEWYLHLFAPEQPDLNWDNPEVRAEYESVLRFWLDRGVDGIRIDVAHGLVKAPGLPDTVQSGGLLEADRTPFWDQDGVHEIYRTWRSILDSYTPERIAVGEAWLPDASRTARYVRPGELHQAFNFELLETPWSGPAYRRAIDASLSMMDEVGAPATWVLSNHDTTRHLTRLALGAGGSIERVGRNRPGRRRPRAAPGPGGHPPAARAARFGLPVPGRGARSAGGPRSAGGRAAGSDLCPYGWRTARPGRVPRPAALVRPGRPVRLHYGFALAASAVRLGQPHCGRRAG